MTFDELEAEAGTAALTISGGFHPTSGDNVPERCETLLLLSPDEPPFWPHFQQTPEFSDGAPDPLDRWSKRMVGALAQSWGGQAIFPSDGPPYPPFVAWALATGRCWSSPVDLLVHDKSGLFISFRGAISLPYRVPLSCPGPSPCDACETRACLNSCPVRALTGEGAYDVGKCQDHLKNDAGTACRHGGCLVRRACPISIISGRDPAQSAFHLAAFLKD